MGLPSSPRSEDRRVWIYAPISNYPERVAGFKQGEVLGTRRISDYLWTHYTKNSPVHNDDLRTCRGCTELLLENTDEFCKPMYRRPMGLKLLDNFDWVQGDTVLFLSVKWSISCLKDMTRLLENLNVWQDPDEFWAHAAIVFIDNDLEFNPLHPGGIGKQRSRMLSEVLESVDVAIGFQRSMKAKFRNFRKKQRRSRIGGNIPMGFIAGPKGVLLPHWEQQKFMRLIAFLRDIAGLTWPKVRDRLIELHNKPGRRYPFITNACVPWSYPQCYKGYKAWKRIQNGEI